MKTSPIRVLLILSLFPAPLAAQSPAGDAAQQIKTLQAEVARLKAENERLAKALEDSGIVLTAAFHTAADIMKGMPADIRPKTGWDKYAFVNLHKWLDEAVIGEPFEAVLVMSTIRVSSVAFAPPAGPHWQASIYFESRSYKTQGMVLEQTLYHSWTQPLKLYGDAEFAREMEAMKPGSRALVKGKIRSIHFGAESKGRIPFDLSLSDYTIEWKK